MKSDFSRVIQPCLMDKAPENSMLAAINELQGLDRGRYEV